VLGTDGAVDDAATGKLRAEIRDERLKAGRPVGPGGAAARTADDTATRWSVAPGLDLVHEAAGRVYACAECATVLAPSDQNFKLGTAVVDRAPHQVDDHRYPNPADFCEDDIVFRSFHCPSCALLLSVEICKRDDEPLWDFELA
jgi:N-methylhydantoinase B